MGSGTGAGARWVVLGGWSTADGAWTYSGLDPEPMLITPSNTPRFKGALRLEGRDDVTSTFYPVGRARG